MKKLIEKLIVLILIISLIPFAAAEDRSNSLSVYDMRKKLGYDFPIYGDTSADMSPLYYYLALLDENGIILKLPDLTINNQEDSEWIYTQFADSFYLTFIPYLDGSKYTIQLQVPSTYRPKDDALTLLIGSILGLGKEESEKLYSSLQYNVIDEWCTIDKEGYSLSFFEPRYKSGELMGFVGLTIDKSSETK